MNSNLFLDCIVFFMVCVLVGNIVRKNIVVIIILGKNSNVEIVLSVIIFIRSGYKIKNSKYIF